MLSMISLFSIYYIFIADIYMLSAIFLQHVYIQDYIFFHSTVLASSYKLFALCYCLAFCFYHNFFFNP